MKKARKNDARRAAETENLPRSGWSSQGRRELPRQAVKFALVGVMNTGIDYLVFLLLAAAGLPALPAHACSYTAGLINSFFWNKLWTFRAPRVWKPGEIVRFVLVNLTALAAAGGVLLAGRDVCGLPAALAKACALPVSLTINFLGNRLWVFPARPAGPPHGGIAV